MPWGACSRPRRRPDAAFLERLDVRIPDAAAGHADLREHAARSDLSGRGASDRSNTGGSAACRGAFPNPATTWSTRISTTSTAPSACPAWASSAGWRGSGHRALCHGAGADGRARRGLSESAAARGRRARRQLSASTKRSTTRRRGCRAGNRSVVVRSFMAHHQGMSFLSLGLSAAGPADAEAIRGRSAVPGDHAAAAGADSQRPRRSIRACCRTVRPAHDCR